VFKGNTGSAVFRYWDPEFIIQEFDKFAKLGITNIKIAESQKDGIPVVHYDSRSPGAQAYIALAEEVLEMEASGCLAREARRRLTDAKPVRKRAATTTAEVAEPAPVPVAAIAPEPAGTEAPAGSVRERFQRYSDTSVRPRLGLIGFDELPSSRPARRVAAEAVPAELRQTPPVPASKPGLAGEEPPPQARATA